MQGCCATCTWCDHDLEGVPRCHNPGCYSDAELAEQAYEIIDSPLDEGCTLYEPA